MKDVIKTTHRADEIKTINGRRVRVNRRQRRNNMKRYYAITMLFLVFIVMFACLTFVFQASNIQINGVSLYREDQIYSVGGITKGANLVRLDTEAIEKRLKDNLVYLDEVSVKKKYPSTLVVECTEAKKSADIKTGESFSVLSSSGRILEVDNAAQDKDIPVVEGLDIKNNKVGVELESKDSKKAEILETVLQAMDKTGLSGISKIDIKDKGDIKLYYKDKIEIKAGSSVDIEYKLGYIKEVIKCLTDDYEGTLIYNGSEGGISAIPKEDDSSISEDDKTKQKSEGNNDNSKNGQDTSTQTDQAQEANAQTDEQTQQPDETQAQQWTQQQDDGNGYDDEVIVDNYGG